MLPRIPNDNGCYSRIDLIFDSYGLASGIMTKDVNIIFAAANQIKAGTLWVNTYLPVFPQCEFGGFKQVLVIPRSFFLYLY